MKRSTKVVASGAALFFAALWGGGYVYEVVAKGTWAENPTAISAMIFAGAGIATCAIGVIAHDVIDKEDRP